MKWLKFLKNGGAGSDKWLTLEKNLLYNISNYASAVGGMSEYGLHDKKQRTIFPAR
jgi:hypothetical protein